MEKKFGEFVFKKKDLEIKSDDGIRYFVNPEEGTLLTYVVNQVFNRMEPNIR